MAGVITAVENDGPADRAGVRSDEELVAVNGLPVTDMIDYLSLSAATRVSLTVKGADGLRIVQIHKDEEESLGLSFAATVFDGIRRCRNHCVFCFVDQLPAGLRSSLYIKDEDYRLSFLQGNYITLTGLSRADRRRITTHRLSPLYVSVHTTDVELRGRLLGQNRPAPILPVLDGLTGAGIKFHTQAVVCPGWNDGYTLDRTIADLSARWPGVQTLAVVPVGLTVHRARLTPLAPFDRNGARALLRQVQRWQERLRTELGTSFVFAADEFYILAGVAMPTPEHYEDYPQLENGVGLVGSFEQSFHAHWCRWRACMRSGRLRVVTGVAATGMWQRLARLVRKNGIGLEILTVANRMLGENVTVAGLLSGRDIACALTGCEKLPTFVPRVALRRGGDAFLDDMTASELIERTGAEVIETDAGVFLRAAARALAHA